MHLLTWMWWPDRSTHTSQRSTGSAMTRRSCHCLLRQSLRDASYLLNGRRRSKPFFHPLTSTSVAVGCRGTLRCLIQTTLTPCPCCELECVSSRPVNEQLSTAACRRCKRHGMFNCAGVKLCINSVAYIRLSIFSGIDTVSITPTFVKCTTANNSRIDDSSMVDVGWSSWFVRCARDGSRGPVKGTCQSRSQRLTCCGQMMAWPLTGLLPACPMCQHPRPSSQAMRSPTTHLGSICLLRSVFTLDCLSTVGICLSYTDVSSTGHCAAPLCFSDLLLYHMQQCPLHIGSTSSDNILPVSTLHPKHSSHMIACH